MKPLAVMNVIPFIDIMLVLLAIVLTTSTFLAQGKIPLRLPEAGTAAAVSTTKALEISIDKAGGIYVDGTPVRPTRLAEHIKAMAADTPVRLRVDKRARFEDFIIVIDVLKAKGMDKLAIITHKAGG
ncbi:TonB system transport protein ExbD [Sulfuriflexus sp.]|uniref:TonB system transport protein ExbD n=1 Tax=Sulfuriflexus sp. TaxID=2015443 RepID=UPI0028CC9D7C|nr:TonB system transport protein ExbD [Sulfuriflexus sp.]MDT8404845.1 TonB system transport protein ExbD [Sulfuriflexus sp.]